MPDHLIKAVLATEDRRFFDHFGIDVLGTFRALIENLRANAVVQGGSSLSQQLAKNLFLSNERTIERKIKEAFLALWLEANLSKHEILKLYLDRAYMGGGTFGVEAASEFYFGKSVKDVNLAEAALLAGLFKAPARYAPHINLPAARARANEVLTNMVQAGFMTEGQVIGARRHPADVVEHARPPGSPDYFLDWAFEQVKELAPARRPRADRAHHHRHGHAARRRGGDRGRRCASTATPTASSRRRWSPIEPDGAVRAMVGGRDYGESQFNRATDALRQPGSSFKPFVYATAMMNGFTPKSVVRDAPICIGNWCPQNYSGGYSGRGHADHRRWSSRSTPSRSASPRRSAATRSSRPRTRMGITSELRITRSLPLGASEVTVLDMAGAYAVFANGGFKATPYAFTQIINSQRRRPLRPPARRAAAGARARRGDRRGDERHARPGAGMGHRPARQARRHQDRRQDRHDVGLSRRLVRRLHRQLRRRGLVRQRRLSRRRGG